MKTWLAEVYHTFVSNTPVLSQGVTSTGPAWQTEILQNVLGAGHPAEIHRKSFILNSNAEPFPKLPRRPANKNYSKSPAMTHPRGHDPTTSSKGLQASLTSWKSEVMLQRLGQGKDCLHGRVQDQNHHRAKSTLKLVSVFPERIVRILRSHQSTG